MLLKDMYASRSHRLTTSIELNKYTVLEFIQGSRLKDSFLVAD